VQVLPDGDGQPDQLAKTEFPSATAVSVTSVAGDVFGIGAVQPVVEPERQSIPPPVTAPVPVPLGFTVSGQVLGWNVA
jgi:hypothetical protein